MVNLRRIRGKLPGFFLVDFGERPVRLDPLAEKAVEETAGKLLDDLKKKGKIQKEETEDQVEEVKQGLREHSGMIKEVTRKLPGEKFGPVEKALISNPVIYACLLFDSLPDTENEEKAQSELTNRMLNSIGALDGSIKRTGDVVEALADQLDGLTEQMRAFQDRTQELEGKIKALERGKGTGITRKPRTRKPTRRVKGR